MRSRGLFLILYTALFLTGACKKDTPPKKESSFGTISSDKRVFITNEGNFGSANASISLFDPNSGNLADDIYKSNNNNVSIGDECQSMSKFNDKFYAVINNSQKIVVLNSETFVKESSITGLISPRYFLPVSNNKAYVTNFKLTNTSNFIQVVDLNTSAVTGSIPCRGWTEEMVLSYGKAFVTNVRTGYVYVVNTANDQIQDSIAVGYGASSIVKDKNEKLWVLCSGDSASNQYPKLHRIDPLSLQIESTFSFSTFHNSPGNLKINGAGDVLYYLRADIYRISITAPALPSSSFIQGGNRLFYGLGIDPLNETIYVSDAIDYIQRGKFLRYDANGNYIDSYTAGLIPGSFYFDY